MAFQIKASTLQVLRNQRSIKDAKWTLLNNKPAPGWYVNTLQQQDLPLQDDKGQPMKSKPLKKATAEIATLVDDIKRILATKNLNPITNAYDIEISSSIIPASAIFAYSPTYRYFDPTAYAIMEVTEHPYKHTLATITASMNRMKNSIGDGFAQAQSQNDVDSHRLTAYAALEEQCEERLTAIRTQISHTRQTIQDHRDANNIYNEIRNNIAIIHENMRTEIPARLVAAELIRLSLDNTIIQAHLRSEAERLSVYCDLTQLRAEIRTFLSDNMDHLLQYENPQQDQDRIQTQIFYNEMIDRDGTTVNIPITDTTIIHNTSQKFDRWPDPPMLENWHDRWTQQAGTNASKLDLMNDPLHKYDEAPTLWKSPSSEVITFTEAVEEQQAQADDNKMDSTEDTPDPHDLPTDDIHQIMKDLRIFIAQKRKAETSIESLMTAISSLKIDNAKQQQAFANQIQQQSQAHTAALADLTQKMEDTKLEHKKQMDDLMKKHMQLTQQNNQTPSTPNTPQTTSAHTQAFKANISTLLQQTGHNIKTTTSAPAASVVTTGPPAKTPFSTAACNTQLPYQNLSSTQTYSTPIMNATHTGASFPHHLSTTTTTATYTGSTTTPAGTTTSHILYTNISGPPTTLTQNTQTNMARIFDQYNHMLDTPWLPNPAAMTNREHSNPVFLKGMTPQDPNTQNSLDKFITEKKKKREDYKTVEEQLELLTFATHPPPLQNKYNGNPLSFLKFAEEFANDIHQNPRATDYTKARTLVQSLTGEPRAYFSTSEWELSNRTYNTMCAAFVQRYFRPADIYKAYMDDIIALPYVAKKDEKSIGLLKTKLLNLYTIINDHYRRAYLNVTDLVEIILAKLPGHLMREINQLNNKELAAAQSTSSYGQNILRIIINVLAQELESMRGQTLMRQKWNTTGTPNRQGYPTKDRSQSRDRHHQDKPAFIIQNQPQPTRTITTCILCYNRHEPQKCLSYYTPAFMKLQNVAAYTKQKKTYCIRCLKAGHERGNCTTTLLCGYCNAPTHHQSLCVKAEAEWRQSKNMPPLLQLQQQMRTRSRSTGRKETNVRGRPQQRQTPTNNTSNTRNSSRTSSRNSTTSPYRKPSTNLGSTDRSRKRSSSFKQDQKARARSTSTTVRNLSANRDFTNNDHLYKSRSVSRESQQSATSQTK